MQLVYFALLPFAYLSSWLTKKDAVCEHPIEALTGLWLLIALFAMSSRWLVRANDLVGSGTTTTTIALRPTNLVWLWCILQPVILTATGWAAIVNEMAHSNSNSLRVLGLLAPSLVLLFLIEWIQASRWCRRMAILHQRATSAGDTLACLWYQAVQSWLIPVTLPIFVACFMDLCTMASVAYGMNQNCGSLIGAALGGMSIIIVMPSVWTMLTQADPVDETVEQIVNRAWIASSTHRPVTLQWQTGGRCPNAMIVGITRQTRRLILTDALLQRLNDAQLTMVVLHELAHCERYHAIIRLLPSFGMISAMLVLSQLANGVPLAILSMFLFVLFIISLTAVCRWTEYDADRHALFLSARLPTEIFTDQRGEKCHPSQCLEDALRSIYGKENMRRSTWLHPSCESRVASIQQIVFSNCSS